MGKTHTNGGKKPRVKISHPNGTERPLDRERYFDVEVIVRITGYGNPEKETHKYIEGLRKMLELHFPQVEIEPVITLP